MKIAVDSESIKKAVTIAEDWIREQPGHLWSALGDTLTALIEADHTLFHQEVRNDTLVMYWNATELRAPEVDDLVTSVER